MLHSQEYVEYTDAMKRFLLIILLSSGSLIAAQEKWDCLILWDQGRGCWEDGVLAFEAFLDWTGSSHRRISPHELNRKELLQYAKLFYVPGGDADYYYSQVSATGISKIQEFVQRGGIYLGICAGAEWACTSFYWEGTRCSYGLDLFEGTAVGPIDELHPWPDHGLTTIAWNDETASLTLPESNSEILYFGGSYFLSNRPQESLILGYYSDYESRPAAVYSPYGNGHVLLFGPHPEIEENHSRDGSAFGRELNDPESDWPMLRNLLANLGFFEDSD